jgi:hypothetical protein
MASGKEAYTPEQLENWSQLLEDLALQPRTRFNKKQTVEALIVPIQRALLVHSYEYVAEQLQEWGLDISSGSLKQYVTRYLREAQSGKRKRKPKDTSPPPHVIVNSMEMTTVEVAASVVETKKLPESDRPEFPRRAPDPAKVETMLAY